MDKLTIHQLEAHCHLGVTELEQRQAQEVWIDLELAIDVPRAAHRDEVHEALDYAAVVTQVRGLVEGKSYRLMETLAEDVATLLVHDLKIPDVLVRVTKRALPGIESAAVEIRRGA
jgi:dihydroneopterin aldolase